MRVTRNGLQALVAQHAVELRFRRRHAKPGWKDHRRMLCTTDRTLLTSKAGRGIFNFTPTIGQLSYNAPAYNLVIAFDIFMQAWRAINCDEVEVISAIKTTPPEKFWEYFNTHIIQMTAEQKMSFMNT